MEMYEFLFDGPQTSNEWHMVYGERMALMFLLDKIRPKVSIEIGTFKGGSLSPISHFSEKVYSIDLFHGEGLKNQFSNVDFITGYSRDRLPSVIDTLNSSDDALEFVLIDGDHSEEGVKCDINNILRYRPKKPLYIVMHDSFNPGVRNGIVSGNWNECKHVHFLETDFVHGVIHDRMDIHKQMWGGLALAVLLPEERKEEIIISKSQEFLYNTIFNLSAHKDGGSHHEPMAAG